MTFAELEAVLQEAFRQCEAAGYPLSLQQQQILLQLLLLNTHEAAADTGALNPLDDLTPEERQRFLHFVREQTRQNRSWKAQLLDDWLQNRDSGEMQFVRDRLGMQWLEQIQPIHIAQYTEPVLQVGDRIEVSSRLWEWVQENSSPEWFPCTVVAMTHPADAAGDEGYTCTVRLATGMEYEIQGIYDWNRYNWRRQGEK